LGFKEAIETMPVPKEKKGFDLLNVIERKVVGDVFFEALVKKHKVCYHQQHFGLISQTFRSIIYFFFFRFRKPRNFGGTRKMKEENALKSS